MIKNSFVLFKLVPLKLASLIVSVVLVSTPAFAADPTFTDADLKTVLAASDKSNDSGLIYMWSPKKHDSIMLAKDVMQVAGKRNMKVTLLHTESNAGTANTQSKLSRSFILRTLGLNAAAPAVMLYHDGELIGRPLAGKINADSISKHIDKTMLEKVECSPKKLEAMGAGAKLPIKCQQLAKRAKQSSSTETKASKETEKK